MKAILVEKPNVMRIIDTEKPQITTSDDVLVRMTAVGICGSDLHIMHGSHPYVQYPRIIGHEGAGIVEAVGDGVTTLKVGDPVVVEAVEFCGKCYACRIGRTNVCEYLKVLGVHHSGTYSEYMKVPERYLIKYDPVLKPVQAVLAEPYTIGAQACDRGNVIKDDLVLIHGAGPIGLITCDIASSRGGRCIVSDVNEKRLELAKSFGAKFTINPLKENLKDFVERLSNGSGVNVIFDAAGAPGLVEQALDIASQAGRIVPMTFSSKLVPINFGLVNKKEITISGTRMECGKFPEVVNFLPSRVDRLDKLVTHVFSIDEYEKAFLTAQDPKSGACKVVMKF